MTSHDTNEKNMCKICKYSYLYSKIYKNIEFWCPDYARSKLMGSGLMRNYCTKLLCCDAGILFNYQFNLLLQVPSNHVGVIC